MAALLSIVVPCYNESGNIPLIFSRFREVLGSRQDVEILLVNNGSKDNSAQVFEAELAKAQDARIRVVNVPLNKGYGYGIMSGLREAKGTTLSWTHADMQTDPNDVLLAYDKYLAANSDWVFVKGKRRNRAAAEQFFTWGMQVVASAALGTALDDVNAQPKLFSRTFFEAHLATGAPDDFSLDLYALYWAHKKCQIIEIPVFFNKRMHGEAKGGGSFKTRIKLIKRTWAYIFELQKALKN
jgi:glycosyltransferase involved in cell wall biosynthesis